MQYDNALYQLKNTNLLQEDDTSSLEFMTHVWHASAAV